MNKIKLAFIIVNLLLFDINLWVYKYHRPIVEPPPIQQPIAPEPTPPPVVPEEITPPEISVPVPSYKDYQGIVEQLREWNKEAPGLTEVGTYGKSSKGSDLYYLRVTNLKSQKEKKKVLITACIHGNEPLSCSTVMACTGTILSQYKDPKIKEMLDTRDLYFVPVVSPDSYPRSRHVDGVDPNRDFPNPRDPNRKSVPPVKAIQDFFEKHQFEAAISGHTFGRVFLTPWGDKNPTCMNQADYQRIVGKMSALSGYRVQRACQMYGHPIFGGEVDWYYRHGAFAIVMEFGTHQQIPSDADTRKEFNMTYESILVFIQEAPEVKVNPQVYMATIQDE